MHTNRKTETESEKRKPLETESIVGDYPNQT